MIADKYRAAFLERFPETGTWYTDTAGLGKLAVFAGVREFPVRVKCATGPA